MNNILIFIRDRIHPILHILWIAAFLALSLWHIPAIRSKITQLQKLRPFAHYTFSGTQFAGLDQFIKDETHIGYLTDISPKNDKLIAKFQQAQFVLAPLVLDLNNADHRYLIIDGSSDQASLILLKKSGAVPLKRNQFGIILAQKP